MARSADDASPDQINMVGEGTVFEGTLRAKSNVRVSGHIKGKLDVEGRAIITPDGVVEGELHATDADVAGSVQGEIHVAERLMLKSTARIDGNITSGRIKVEEGALFSGQCEIGEGVADKVKERTGSESTGDAPSSGTSVASGSSGSSSSSSGSSASARSKKASSSESGGGTKGKTKASKNVASSGKAKRGGK